MLKKVYIVSTPMGNQDDISPRAIKALERSDGIIVEEYKQGKKKLDLLKIDISKKKLIPVNEHNEKKINDSFLTELITNYNYISIISDAGTPLIGDPGNMLVKKLVDFKIPVTHISGACSVISALVLSGFPADRFYYAGFLPPQKEKRLKTLKNLRGIKSSIIIMETPYRLIQLLKGVKGVFSPGKEICICFNLSKDNEYIFRGTVNEALTTYSEKKKKEEFVLVISPPGNWNFGGM